MQQDMQIASSHLPVCIGQTGGRLPPHKYHPLPVAALPCFRAINYVAYMFVLCCSAEYCKVRPRPTTPHVSLSHDLAALSDISVQKLARSELLELLCQGFFVCATLFHHRIIHLYIIFESLDSFFDFGPGLCGKSRLVWVVSRPDEI